MAKKTIAKVTVPETLHKAIVLFVAALVVALTSRLLGSLSILLDIISIVLIVAAFYFVLKWSGLWEKIKK